MANCKYPSRRRWSAAAIGLIAVCFAGGVFMPKARAQENNTPAASVSAAMNAPVTSIRLNRVPAKEAAARLTKETGTLILTEASVANTLVTLDIGRSTLEAALKQMSEQMPKGAAVRSVMLPKTAPGATAPDADVVASLIGTQEQLVGSVMGAKVERTTGSINVLGKILTADKAKPVIDALDLKPAFVVGIPGGGGDPLQRMTSLQAEGLKLWLGLNPDQQRAAMENQFDWLLNMDPNARRAMFGQMQQQAAVMMQKLQSLPPDQRRQFFLDITNGQFDGTTPPRPPGAGGGGGGQ